MRTDYDRLAGRYDEDRAGWSLPRDDVINELLASCSVVRVLDLGCGTGRSLAAQRDFFDDSRVALLGADPSSAMLAEAHAKRIANIIRSRAEDLPLNDIAIDYVACSYAFHHFSDKDRAVDEVARVLTAGGVFRINNFEPTAADGYWCTSSSQRRSPSTPFGSGRPRASPTRWKPAASPSRSSSTGPMRRYRQAMRSPMRSGACCHTSRC